MPDTQPDTLHFRQRLLQRLDHHDGPVPAARAPNRDRQVALPFVHVLRQRESEERREALEKLSC